MLSLTYFDLSTIMEPLNPTEVPYGFTVEFCK